MPQRERLDTLVHERGLAPSRTRAHALVLAGQVTVDGVVVSKAGAPTARDAAIALVAPDHPYVGRGGIKLAHALDTFGITPVDALALDIGASTGGFTEVLLQRGARRVVALDVGRGQLAWKLRQDPRVVVMDGVNARGLEPGTLPDDCRQFDVVTIDVAFISIQTDPDPHPPVVGPRRSHRCARQAAVRGRTSRSRESRDRHQPRRARAGHRRRDGFSRCDRIDACRRLAFSDHGSRG